MPIGELIKVYDSIKLFMDWLKKNNDKGDDLSQIINVTPVI